jgi:hypothetical protein
MNVAIFWNIAPWIDVLETQTPARGLFIAWLIFDAEDGSDVFLRNICSHTDYTTLVISYFVELLRHFAGKAEDNNASQIRLCSLTKCTSIKYKWINKMTATGQFVSSYNFSGPYLDVRFKSLPGYYLARNFCVFPQSLPEYTAMVTYFATIVPMHAAFNLLIRLIL